MRIALDSATEVGARTGRVLLAEPSVTYLGLIQPPAQRTGPRSGPAGDLSYYTVIVSDGTTPANDLIARSSVYGIPLVLWFDEPGLHRGPAAAPVVVGANVGSTLAPALMHHPSAVVTESDAVTIAWTEPGTPRRKGTAVAFPEPVGVVWATERSAGKFVAHRTDEWGGAVITASGPQGDRVIGVADHAAHLEALTLAAVTLVAAENGYEARIQDAAVRGEQVLAKAMDLELDVAVWRFST